MNSLTVPRRQGDAVGAICKLTNEKTKSTLTINVEYNQLEGLLGKQEPTYGENGNKYSVYPGNINVFILQIPEYHKVLERTNGVISEFVNPKYAEGSKSVFKKPTRLECMMQDIPKLFSADQKVGFSQFEAWAAFSPVKNNLADGAAKQRNGNAPETASSGETDIFYWNRRILQRAGVQFENPKTATYKGVVVADSAKLVLAPSFGVTQREIVSKFTGGKSISFTNKGTLVLDGRNITIGDNVSVDGALSITAKSPSVSVQVQDLKLVNDGWNFQELDSQSASTVTEAVAIRGYKLVKTANSAAADVAASSNITISDAFFRN
jgi:UDP-sugar pyrophosphorylase